MGELIRREGAVKPLAFSGERLTSAMTGQVEIEHYHRYLLARDFCRGLDVLDVASGEGYGAALLAQVARSVVGVEIDAEAVAGARREFVRGNLRFEAGDACALPLEAKSIDVVISFETLEHLAEQDRFLGEICRVLRPDGLLIISTPDRDVYSPLGQAPNPFHVRELTRLEFETLVRRHFEYAAVCGQRPLIGSVFAGAGAGARPFRTFERRGPGLLEGSDELARAPYLLAFASAAPLPPIADSVYVYRSDLDTDGQVRHEAEIGRAAAEREAAEAVARCEAALLHAQERVADAEARRVEAESRIGTALEQASHYKARVIQSMNHQERTERRAEAAEQRADAAERRAEGAEERAVLAGRDGARAEELQVAFADAERRVREADELIAVLQRRVAEEAEGWERADRALRAAGEQLRAIDASSVWRAMYPLRVVAGRHPRLARGVSLLLKVVWWAGTLQLRRRYGWWRDARRLTLAGPQIAEAEALPIAAPALLSPPAPLAPVVEPLPSPVVAIRVPCSADPLVSIVICTYGQASLTLACLGSIAGHPPACPFEVIVLDDAYPRPEDVGVLQLVSGVHLLRNASNLGFLRSTNHAVRTARGRYVYLLNNDTEVRPGAVDALVALLESRADVGMAGSKLLYPDGRLQEAGGILWTDASGWNYGRGGDPGGTEFNYVREVDYCSGASLLVRRELWEALGGFDEAFVPAYYEDADLAFRVRAAGFKVLYEPRSEVVHHEGASHGTDISVGVKAHQVANQARMLQRWGETLVRENYPNAEHVFRARDRARHRRSILVVDHYTPEPDRDAGSRSMFNLLEALVDAGWLVKFWPYNRLYSPVYTPPLERLGIEVLDGRYPGDLWGWLQSNGGELDHLMVSRPDTAADLMQQLVRGSTSAVFSFYGIDLHHARMRRQAEIQGRPELLADAAEMERLERRVWRNFDVVIYLSEEEAAAVRAMSPPTVARAVIPYAFAVEPARVRPPENDRTLLFVAGFAHPPNVDAALFLLQEIVPRLERECGPVSVVLAGSGPSEAVRALAGPAVEVTGWLSDADLAARYARHRVAVVPLRFGAGVKGKVVEALSRGLPLVTTGTGAQGIEGLSRVVPVHDDVEGIVAALRTLLIDDEAWIAQSRAQLAFAEARFSRAAMQRSVIEALEAGEATLCQAQCSLGRERPAA